MMMWGDPLGASTLNQPFGNDEAISDTASSSTSNNNNHVISGMTNPTSSVSSTTSSAADNPKTQQCTSSLLQITGPAHISTNDRRWQELFLTYDILVHLERGQIYQNDSHGKSSSTGAGTAATATYQTQTLMDQVCKSMAKHARNSSNLAGFAWHLTQMLNEVINSCIELSSSNSTSSSSAKLSPATHNHHPNTPNHNYTNIESTPYTPTQNNATLKIAMVGKARVVCGAMNLFRILTHEIITASFCHEEENTFSHEYLQETFTYTPRQKDITTAQQSNNVSGGSGVCGSSSSAASSTFINNYGGDIDTSTPLLSSLLSFISLMGGGRSEHYHPKLNPTTTDNNDTTTPTPQNSNISAITISQLLKTIPELYDATVQSLSLINILFSTQLYQPLISSFELKDLQYNNNTSKLHFNFFLDKVMSEAFQKRQLQKQFKHQQYPQQGNANLIWSSQMILTSCLNWIITRPSPPSRSITAHLQDMVTVVARDLKGEKPGLDGMYENHMIVMSKAPTFKGDNDGKKGGDDTSNNNTSGGSNGDSKRQLYSNHHHRSAPKIIIDATSNLIHLSSSLLLLPFRLMTLALRALGHHHFLLGGGKGADGNYDHVKLAQLQAAYGARGGVSSSIASPTNDVLWLSDSPIADLASTFFLILVNNHRASSSAGEVAAADSTGELDIIQNPFRSDLASLDDNRWDGWNHSSFGGGNGSGYLEGGANGAFETIDLDNNNGNKNNDEVSSLLHSYGHPKPKKLLTTNFEHLFQSFGGTLHNELGSLMLYTILQSSPIFAASIAVRSDLDMLVLPLLRTMYFSSSITNHISGRTTAASSAPTPTGEAISSASTVSVMERPFRSQSQLYVIMILLLIFSQDTSFGPDSFRRSNIPVVVWYKERHLKDISLGSLMVLSLLRSISYNLNRMQDPFLLSNCCAVFLNLSPHIVNLHSYASMRLASVLISIMKRYTVLVMKNGGKPAEEGDVNSLLGMYGEACRILMQVVKHSIRRKVIDKNLHLIYALVYHQRDFNTVLRAKRSPFRPSDTEKIASVMKVADEIILNASARTAEKALEELNKFVDTLKGNKSSSGKSSSSRTRGGATSPTDESTISTASSSTSTISGMEDFRFTYEEEADPEIFFVPYLWEIIVSAVTASTLEWHKKKIKAFALLHHVAEDMNVLPQDDWQSSNQIHGAFADNVDDIV